MRSTPRMLFGIHSIAPWSRKTGEPYGILKVIGGGNLELTGESEDLYGGSSRFPYASEATQINSSLQAQVKSYPDFLMELFLGASARVLDPSPTGEVSGFVNKKGTSVKATTGIAFVGVKSGFSGNVKKGRLVLKATSATQVNAYYLTDIDFAKGTGVEYLEDSLLVASGLTVTSGGTIELDDFGLELTGGGSAISLEPGDTAIADVYPPHDGASIVSVGDANAQFPSFGADMYAAKRSTGEIFCIRCFNCVGSGMPLQLQEKAWSISDLTIKLLRDEKENKVFDVIHVRGK